jgi:hypothetical protein
MTIIEYNYCTVLWLKTNSLFSALLTNKNFGFYTKIQQRDCPFHISREYLRPWSWTLGHIFYHSCGGYSTPGDWITDSGVHREVKWIEHCACRIFKMSKRRCWIAFNLVIIWSKIGFSCFWQLQLEVLCKRGGSKIETWFIKIVFHIVVYAFCILYTTIYLDVLRGFFFHWL